MKLHSLWFLLIAVRFVWTFLPQTGYIHPDEFFQSVEVIAGDVFDLDIMRSWEFNTSLPIRSIVPLYVLTGIPLLILKFAVRIAGESLLTWYSVTVTIRFTMTLISLFVDLTVYRLCRKFGDSRGDSGVAGLLLISTSYIILVFYTRPFSNTIESFLFAALVYCIICSPHRTARHLVSKVEPKPSDTTFDKNYSFTIPLLVVAGFFNRPTFLVYAIVPYLYWLLKGVTSQGDILYIVQRGIKSVVTAIPLAVIFVVCDSLYFRCVAFDQMHIMSQIQSSGLSGFLLSNLTVTPLNFLRYNVQMDNLADHGVHPRITHLAVNIPLLFGVLGMFLIYDLISLVYRCFCKQQPALDSLGIMLVMSCIIPTILLSLFPHQEPRFLIPLLMPLSVLYSHRIFGDSSSLPYRTLWIALNLLGAIFFGVLHQGGIVRALGYIQHETASTATSNSNRLPTDLVFWHTYMPPRYLLLQPISEHCSPLSASSWPVSANVCDCHATRLHDLAGRPVESLIDYLKLVNSSLSQCAYSQHGGDVRLVVPGSLHHELYRSLASAGIRHKLLVSFWPHFSSEDPPSISDIMCTVKTAHREQSHGGSGGSDRCTLTNAFVRIMSTLSLNVYKVTYL